MVGLLLFQPHVIAVPLSLFHDDEVLPIACNISNGSCLSMSCRLVQAVYRKRSTFFVFLRLSILTIVLQNKSVKFEGLNKVRPVNV